MKYNGIEITPEWDDNIPYCGVSKCSAFGKMGCSHGLVWSEGKRCDSAIRSMRRKNEDLRTAQEIDKMRGELLQEIDDALLPFWVGGRLNTIEQIMEDVKRLQVENDAIRKVYSTYKLDSCVGNQAVLDEIGRVLKWVRR